MKFLFRKSGKKNSVSSIFSWIINLFIIKLRKMIESTQINIISVHKMFPYHFRAINYEILWFFRFCSFFRRVRDKFSEIFRTTDIQTIQTICFFWKRMVSAIHQYHLYMISTHYNRRGVKIKHIFCKIENP